MSGRSKGSSHSPYPQKSDWSGRETIPLDRTSSWSSRTDGRPYQERCVDPVEPKVNHYAKERKVPRKETNGTEFEKVVFLPAQTDPPSETRVCGPCASVASCRRFVCTVLTCGLYRVCRRVPCLMANESSQEEPKKDEPVTSDLAEDDFYPDIRICGREVEAPSLDKMKVVYSAPTREMDTLPFYRSSSGLYGPDLNEDDWGDGDVDSLINRKLLEVFTQFEIDELAKCTSDSMFLKRSREISQLINEIVHEHNLEEQDAETRLVREIIRLSTRKSKKRPPVRRQETPPDSGNETMRATFSTDSNGNHQDDIDFQISSETPFDKRARQMRANGDQLHSPTLSSPYSRSYRETDTDSSGAPLLHKYIST
ncbi:keratinocyte differentiation factor 1 [Chanos chanos]|uniref:Keratinocyte differentiation factor 1 n=1 Tax=Chanos chanos TaxID=29144 RepID=A0A6J2WH98_CHACN|nr:keratinocyte differentiation factor 1-like [Chanos chanos]